MTAQPQRPAMQQPSPTSGSTAPRLEPAAPWRPAVTPAPGRPTSPDQAPHRRRTPLSVAPAPLPASGRGFATLCILLLLSALATVLVLNITVSNRQYELVALNNEQTELTQVNERLTQEAEHLAAPQNLAGKAAELGMVMPGDVASIDLDTGAVRGSSTPALKEDAPTEFVAAPSVPGGQGVAAEDPEAPADAPAEAPPADAPAEAAPAEAPADPAPAAEAADEFDGQDLNGGTIPAPQLQPGQD